VRLKTKAMIAFGLICSLGVVAWFWAAPVIGYIAAHRDVHAGKIELLGYGLTKKPGPTPSLALLNLKYSTGFKSVGGCVVSRWTSMYVSAYNSVITNVAHKRYGKNIFIECGDLIDKAEEDALNSIITKRIGVAGPIPMPTFEYVIVALEDASNTDVMNRIVIPIAHEKLQASTTQVINPIESLRAAMKQPTDVRVSYNEAGRKNIEISAHGEAKATPIKIDTIPKQVQVIDLPTGLRISVIDTE